MSNILSFERGQDLQEERNNKTIEQIKSTITKLQAGIEKYKEWQQATLKQGDQQSALLYEIKALEDEMLIMEGENLCHDLDNAQFEHWQQYSKHATEAEYKQRTEEDLEMIDWELESIANYLNSLLEDNEDNVGDNKEQKINELRERREKLESKRQELLSTNK